ncbi:MAG TPA: GNAT family N-acetyltransferase [Deltaproteobacteria bacterium]|nr:GNAT family N-acetyltransferase [Deltaproteobacteria bacterium]
MMNPDDIANYTVEEKLRDHRTATIRAIRPGDKELFREAFKGLEAGSIYMRFFGPRKELTDRELVLATEVDFVRTVALVACVQERTGERIVGGGRYIAYEGPDPSSAAEVAFMVEEDYQGQGLASILLKHLLLIGRGQGISRFEADVLHANKKMLRVFERAGLPVVTKASGDSIHVTMLLNKDETPSAR